MKIGLNREEIIRTVVTNAVVYDYITAEFGEILGIYPDGSVGIGQSVGNEIAEGERPFVVVRCPGFANQDSSAYTEPWKYDPETDMYIDEDGYFHDMDDCIRLAIENDNSFKEGLIRLLEESL